MTRSGPRGPAPPRSTPATASSSPPACIGIGVVVVLITWAKVHPFLASDPRLGGTGGGGDDARVGHPRQLHQGLRRHHRQRRHPHRPRRHDRQAARGLRWCATTIVADHRGTGRARGGCPGPWPSSPPSSGCRSSSRSASSCSCRSCCSWPGRPTLPVMKVGIPALAGLSVLHGLVPPHPGPLTAIAPAQAPTSVGPCSSASSWPFPPWCMAGPVLAVFITRHGAPKLAPEAAEARRARRRGEGARRSTARRVVRRTGVATVRAAKRLVGR